MLLFILRTVCSVITQKIKRLIFGESDKKMHYMSAFLVARLPTATGIRMSIIGRSSSTGTGLAMSIQTLVLVWNFLVKRPCKYRVFLRHNSEIYVIHPFRSFEISTVFFASLKYVFSSIIFNSCSVRIMFFIISICTRADSRDFNLSLRAVNADSIRSDKNFKEKPSTT